MDGADVHAGAEQFGGACVAKSMRGGEAEEADAVGGFAHGALKRFLGDVPADSVAEVGVRAVAGRGKEPIPGGRVAVAGAFVKHGAREGGGDAAAGVLVEAHACVAELVA